MEQATDRTMIGQPTAPLKRQRAALLRSPWAWGALAVGLALKVVILVTGASTFDGDEAIIGLMARHILQGEHTVFFYGQFYMGALDAYLAAGSFLLFGEGVLAIRVVQVALFTGVLVSTMVLAHRLTSDATLAAAAGLLIAVPPVLFSTYTTASLGNYVEVLLLNNLIFLIGWDILTDRAKGPGWWLLIGVLGGLGWWSMASVVVSILPLAVLGLWHFRRGIPWGRVVWLVAGFVVGAAPWFFALITEFDTVVANLFGSRVAQAATEAGDVLSLRALNVFLFNIPALFGLRPPWAVDWILLPVGIAVSGFYLLVLFSTLRHTIGPTTDPYAQMARLSLLGAFVLILGVMVATRFGVDPTGRYLLHLYPPLVLLVALWLHNARMQGAPRWLAPAVIAVLVGFNLWGNVRAIVQNPPGLTTQFNPRAHIPHTYDDDLIAFLDSIGAEHGYSNYWIAFRFAFLTQERILLAPRLPYQEALTYSEEYNRYPAYTAAADSAEEVVYVTSNHPLLDEVLMGRFDALDVRYRVERIGHFTVFYDLSRHITPAELGTLEDYYPGDAN